MEEHRRILREFLILLSIYLLPAIYSGTGPVDSSLFEQPRAHIGILIQNVPRILLLLYIMEIDGGAWTQRFGLSPRASRLPLRALAVALLLLAISVITNLLSRALGIGGDGTFRFESVTPFAYLLSVFSLLSVGYTEELFFRSYAVTRLAQLGLSPPMAIFVSAILFSLGHAYQGFQGLLFAFLAGLALGYLYQRIRGVHPLAIGHAAYNYAGLLFSGLF
ncbi:MAG: CPBP family intramembrane glutamic endopeptidase [Spirochaetaceae bacterium]